jgi:hypothetical protein
MERALGVVGLFAGAALIGVGGYLGYYAAATPDSVNRLCTTQAPCSALDVQTREQKGQTFGYAADGLWATGGALVAVGVVLSVVGWR